MVTRHHRRKLKWSRGNHDRAWPDMTVEETLNSEKLMLRSCYSIQHARRDSSLCHHLQSEKHPEGQGNEIACVSWR